MLLSVLCFFFLGLRLRLRRGVTSPGGGSPDDGIWPERISKERFRPLDLKDMARQGLEGERGKGKGLIGRLLYKRE